MARARRSGGGKDPVVDIEHLLVEYAWRELAEPSLLDRLLRRRRYRMDVNWSYLDIAHRVTDFRPRCRDLVTSSKAAGVGGDAAVQPVVGPRELCLFR